MADTVYGVCYGDGIDMEIEECKSREAAEARAQALVDEGKGGADGVDVVELEGRGPCYADDGSRLADTHAPCRTLATIR